MCVTMPSVGFIVYSGHKAKVSLLLYFFTRKYRAYRTKSKIVLGKNARRAIKEARSEGATDCRKGKLLKIEIKKKKVKAIKCLIAVDPESRRDDDGSFFPSISRSYD